MANTPVQKISELEAKLTQVTTERDALVIERDQFKAAAEAAPKVDDKMVAELANEKTEHGKVQVALAEANKKVGTLEAEVKALKEDFDTKVTKAASEKAAQIAASQHIPPVQSKVNTDQAKTEPESKKPKSYLEALASGFVTDAAKTNGTK